MEKIKEEELEKFRFSCQLRFHPEHMTFLMVGIIIYTSIVMFVFFDNFSAYGFDYYTTTFEKIIIGIEMILYGLQVVTFIMYFIPKLSYKLQKFQGLLLLLYLFQGGTIGFVLFILPGLGDYYPNVTTQIYISLLFVGAVIVHIVSAVDIFKQAREGAFNKIGEPRSSFSEKKKGIVEEIGVYAFLTSMCINVYNEYGFVMFVIQGVLTIGMYIVAAYAAQLYLLVYCRVKFPSFHMSWEEYTKPRREVKDEALIRKQIENEQLEQEKRARRGKGKRKKKTARK